MSGTDTQADGREPTPTTRYLVVAAMAASAVGLAWTWRFVCDDAYISFRFARNFAEGHGLVWQPGVRVEGYTNFLWTLMLGGAMRAGVSPVTASYVLGIGSLVATLVLTYRLAGAFLRPTRQLAATGLVAANYSMLAFGTSGLATMFQTALVTGVLYLGVRLWREGDYPPWRLVALSVLGATALLVRLDSGIAVGLALGVTACRVLRSSGEGPARIGRLAALAGPMALILGVWFAWKLSFYGHLLPNTFWAKTGDASWLRGMEYLGNFIARYGLVVPMVVALLAGGRRDSSLPWSLRVLGVYVGLWALYLVAIGGDFIGYRFMVPVIPVATVVGVRWFVGLKLPTTVAGSVATFLVAMSFGQPRLGLTEQHYAHQNMAFPSYRRAGQALGEATRDGPELTIATAASGAIPYYSRLPAVDMLGLVDPQVVRDGLKVSSIPGHQRIARLGYLMEREVDLIVSTPWFVECDMLAEQVALEAMEIYLYARPAAILGRDPRLVAIPIGAGQTLLALDLRHSEALETTIRENGWRTIPVVERASQGASVCRRVADNGRRAPDDGAI